MSSVRLEFSHNPDQCELNFSSRQAGVGITVTLLKDLQEQLGVAGSLDKVLGQTRAVVGVGLEAQDLSSQVHNWS